MLAVLLYSTYCGRDTLSFPIPPAHTPQPTIMTSTATVAHELDVTITEVDAAQLHNLWEDRLKNGEEIAFIVDCDGVLTMSGVQMAGKPPTIMPGNIMAMQVIAKFIPWAIASGRRHNELEVATLHKKLGTLNRMALVCRHGGMVAKPGDKPTFMHPIPEDLPEMKAYLETQIAAFKKEHPNLAENIVYHPDIDHLELNFAGANENLSGYNSFISFFKKTYDQMADGKDDAGWMYYSLTAGFELVPCFYKKGYGVKWLVENVPGFAASVMFTHDDGANDKDMFTS